MQINGPVSTLLTWKPLSQALRGCSHSPTSPGEGARTYHPPAILGWHRSPQGKGAHDWPSVLGRKDAAHTGAHIPVPTPPSDGQLFPRLIIVIIRIPIIISFTLLLINDMCQTFKAL